MSSHLLNHLSNRKQRAGATLVESMIALSLFAGLSAAVFPLFTLSRKTIKQSSLRSECQRIVDLKAAQYRKSFSYAAARYKNKFNLGVCNSAGTSAATSPLWRGKVLGMRECIESSDPTVDASSWRDLTIDSADSFCLSTTDVTTRQRLPGFKLYVRLTRSNPWITQPSTPAPSSDPAARDAADCPKDSADSTGYSFLGAQDGIQLTVTGIIDSVTTLLSPTERQCQATTILEPTRKPFRYLLKADGRIYDASGMGTSGLSADESVDSMWVFQSIYSTDGTAPGLRERGLPIRAFSVHPLNRSLWVLRAGLLSRYSDCGGTTLDCTTTPSTNGISDTGANRGSWPSVQNFTVSDSIQSIAVDYLHNRVYAVTQATHDSERALGTTPRGRGLYRMALAGSPETDLPAVTTETADTELVSLAAEGSSGLAADVPFFVDDRFPDRVLGMFTNPAADTAFVIAPYTAPEWDSTQNVTGVFLGTDYRLLTPIAVFPEKIIGFSP